MSGQKQYANKIVLGGDTLNYHNGQIIDKVKSIEKAKKKNQVSIRKGTPNSIGPDYLFKWIQDLGKLRKNSC